jgi:hypothetical protein
MNDRDPPRLDADPGEDPELAALVGHLREHRLEPEQVQRVAERLGPVLDGGPGGGGPGAGHAASSGARKLLRIGGWTKIVGVAAVGSAAAVALFVAWPGGSPSQNDTGIPQASGSSGSTGSPADPHTSPSPRAEGPGPGKETPDPSAPKPPAPADDPADAPEKPVRKAKGEGPEPAAADVAKSQQADAPVPDRTKTAEASGDSSGPGSDALAEARLIRRARMSLEQDPERSLRLTGKHRGRFPDGDLVQEREVVALDALVRLGRTQKAKARAERFFQRWPDSAHRTHIEKLFNP